MLRLLGYVVLTQCTVVLIFYPSACQTMHQSLFARRYFCLSTLFCSPTHLLADPSARRPSVLPDLITGPISSPTLSRQLICTPARSAPQPQHTPAHLHTGPISSPTLSRRLICTPARSYAGPSAHRHEHTPTDQYAGPITRRPICMLTRQDDHMNQLHADPSRAPI